LSLCYPGAQSGPDLHSLTAALFAGTGDKFQVKAATRFQEVVGMEG